MGNIFNHNRLTFDFHINKGEYWDFFLSQTPLYGYDSDGLQTRCLISYIDTENPNCVDGEKLHGNEEYVWENAVNNGVELKNIGFTGVDNGLISYQKDRTSNAKFYELFTKSRHVIEADDKRLTVQKVHGNNMIYDYTNNIVEEDGKIVSRLNGGFYQGFFRTDCDYQILPKNIENGWMFEMMLKKSDLDGVVHDTKYPTLNDMHPENKGIFFYIGTRAENKWWKGYDTKTTFDPACNHYFIDGYVKDEYHNEICLNSAYFHVEEPFEADNYFADGYIVEEDKYDGCCVGKARPVPTPPRPVQYRYKWKYPEALNTYQDNTKLFDGEGHYWEDNELKRTPTVGFGGTVKYPESVCTCDQYFSSDYLSDGYYSNSYKITDRYVKDYFYVGEMEIDENEELKTVDGHSIFQPNVVEFRSDNKFLMFDHTCDGVTTKTYEEGMEVEISDIRLTDAENYFILFNHTHDGYTTRTIGDYEREKGRYYNVLKDIYRNALAFQITDDGRIGYKYLVKDCDSEEDVERYKIESEFSNEGVVKDEKWTVIDVKIIPIGRHVRTNVSFIPIEQKMRIMIYVDGRLRLISRELPMLNLKELKDTMDKQEGVPYNISLGGGTQGLGDVVYLNFRKVPEYRLPLENEFAGSFIGYMKLFKMYGCNMFFDEIRKNVSYETKRIGIF